MKDATQYYLAIPLKTNSYALALVAAHASGLVCLHVFREVHHCLPVSAIYEAYEPADVATVVRVYDIALLEERWAIIGYCLLEKDEFRRKWGVPAFGWVDTIDFERFFRIEYNDDLVTHTDYPCSLREALRLDHDGILDSGALSDHLEAMLIDRAYDDDFLRHAIGRERGLLHLKNLRSEG